MHPINTFPALLDFVRLSPFIIRLVAGLFIFALGRDRQRKPFKEFSVIYYALGLAVMLGWYTQYASIFGIVLLKLDFYIDYWKKRKSVPVPKHYYFLYSMAILILVSLLFSGGGFQALDMPF